MAEQEKSILWSGTLAATAEQGVNTGVTLNTRDPNITITVKGSAKFWPGDGPWGPEGKPNDSNQDKMLDPKANAGAVLMKVTGGPYRPIGKGMSDWIIREDGELTFFYNDQPGNYGDNSGSFDIAVLRQLVWNGPLPANAEDGVKTGIIVNTSTDKISISVKGTTNFGGGYPDCGPDGDPNYTDPNALLLSAHNGACLMRVGTGPYRLVGTGMSDWTVREDGEIVFFYNDGKNEFSDNTGSYTITLTVN